MLTKLSKAPFRHLLKETQTIVTILYIFAVGVGMLFNYQKFSEFGINIFDYAGVFEFLVAPFADYRILLFTLISFILSYSFYRLDILWSTKYPRSYSRLSFGWNTLWNGRLRFFSYLVLVVMYLYISADFYGKLKRKDIINQPVIQLKYQDNEVLNGRVIGVAGQILFLFAENKTTGIPVSGLIKEFEIR